MFARYSDLWEILRIGTISPEKLPPTARAAHFHGLRVHHQIMTWLFLHESADYDPSEWGWIHKENMLLPVLTDIDIAPLEVKTVTHCNCNPNLKAPCSSRLCSCRKLGLPCISLCGGCRGEDCTNTDVSNVLICAYHTQYVSITFNKYFFIKWL